MCARGAPKLKPGQEIKVLSWNVQYMAGKNYVFYYDRLDNQGPDERPSTADIEATLDGVARIIAAEKPDIVLLQEIDESASRTDGKDQLQPLLTRLPPGLYPCHADTFYWRAAFVPHPRIMGSVGMKLSTLSRFEISSAARLALPMLRQDPATDMFYLQRAILSADLPVEGKDQPYVVFNTHLDAFAQGTNTMELQIASVQSALRDAQGRAHAWLIGGDFNLLATDASYERLGTTEKAYFNPKTELAPLVQQHRSIPSASSIPGPDHARWFTHFPNDPRIGKLDRTIDYIFVPKDTPVLEERVLHGPATRLSDHMPLITTIRLP